MPEISKRQQEINKFEEELAKEAGKKRKQDTRRKILVGAMILGEMRNNPNLERQVLKRLDNFLDRDIDRELFGFESK